MYAMQGEKQEMVYPKEGEEKRGDIMSINSKAKGRKGELELANLLKAWGYDTRRSQQYCGANGDADVVGVPGMHIECKRVEKLNIYNAMKQSISDAREGEMPVVMFRKNGEEWLTALRTADHMAMKREMDELRHKVEMMEGRE